VKDQLLARKPGKLNPFLFLGLGLVIVVLVAEGVYLFKLSGRSFLGVKETPEPEIEEEPLSESLARVFNFENNQVTQTIIDDLEQAKEFDPQKSEVEAGMQYLRYTSAASTMIALYYSSGDNPQNRNQEMLSLIAKVRELARQNSHFNEEDWKIEGVESY
jgi:hypothetical protein